MKNNTDSIISKPKGNNNLFTPDYIPYYIFLEEEGLNHSDIKLFGFIFFYLTSSSNTFYFTNEDLAQILKSSPRRISASVSNLKNRNLIFVKILPQSNKGVYRLISLNNQVVSELSKKYVGGRQKWRDPHDKNGVEIENIKKNK